MIEKRYFEERSADVDDATDGEELKLDETNGDNLRALFPDLPDAQLAEVAETLHGYCTTVWRIYERLQREHPEVIDDLIRTRRIKGKVDSST